MVKSLLLLTVILLWTVATDNIAASKADPIETPGGISSPQKPNRAISFRKQDLGDSYSLVEKQVTNSQTNSKEILNPVNVDTYNLATYVFNLQKYFNYCDRCKRLQYLAFRVGRYYLTAKNSYLQLETNSSPNNNQLFIAEQQVDGSWAFKSLTQNKYLRASNDGTTINYQTYVGPWQRWYMQRHGDHVHIQSAQWIYHWWIFDNYVLQQMDGGASALIVQYWPKLQWLWNW